MLAELSMANASFAIEYYRHLPPAFASPKRFCTRRNSAMSHASHAMLRIPIQNFVQQSLS